MATYYVDPAATGSDDGTSWANAWTSLQRAIDGTGGTAPVAGDTVYCRGTETVSTAINFGTGNEGNITNGAIRYVGCNASGVEDGTQFVLDGNNGSNDIFAGTTTGRDYIYIANFKIHNCTGNGFTYDTFIYGWVWVNCRFTDCNIGLFGTTSGCLRRQTFYDCSFDNCDSHGVDRTFGAFYRCWFADNGGAGLYQVGSGQSGHFQDCVFADNTNEGCYIGCYGPDCYSFTRCVFHGNNHGLRASSNIPGWLIDSCRFTGNTTNGILATSKTMVAMVNCYMPDTGESLANGTNVATTVDLIEHPSYPNVLDGTDSNGGYTDYLNDDFSLASGATLRDVGVTLGGGVSSSDSYSGAGLQLSGSSGGSTVIVVDD